MASRLNPSASAMGNMRDKILRARDSSVYGEQATALAARFDSTWALSPQTDNEKGARKRLYHEALIFIQDHGLR